MTMYLVDTDVISEARRGNNGNPGVRQFFQDAERNGDSLYLSAVTIGELDLLWKDTSSAKVPAPTASLARGLRMRSSAPGVWA